MDETNLVNELRKYKKENLEYRTWFEGPVSLRHFLNKILNKPDTELYKSRIKKQSHFSIFEIPINEVENLRELIDKDHYVLDVSYSRGKGAERKYEIHFSYKIKNLIKLLDDNNIEYQKIEGKGKSQRYYGSEHGGNNGCTVPWGGIT